MTLGQWVMVATDRLAAAGVPEPRPDAFLLAAHGLGQSRSWVLAHRNDEVNPEALEALLRRREKREPLAYITGHREFYGREFAVRPGVLVPRPETEALVDEIVLELDRVGAESFLEIGVGSGCVVTTVSVLRPEVRCYGCDNSPVALEVTRENVATHNALVSLESSDLLAAYGDQRFDVMAMNPPYIPDGTPLMPEVAEYEPGRALYAGSDGLDVYQRLAIEAWAHVQYALVLEVPQWMQRAVRALFLQASWRVDDVETETDVLVVRPH
jgi:release factor glutamine methyltransferase